MNTKNLNIELLKSLDACESGIDFVKRANLEGFPLSKLDQVEGDYNGFVDWLRQELKTVRVYNDQGLMTKRVNPLGRVYEYEYKDQGVMTKRVNPLGDVYRYEYNDQGLMTKEVLHSGGVREYEYNGQGLMTKEVYPSGDVYEYEYNDKGLITKEVYSSGGVCEYEYNGQGLMTKRVDPSGRVCEYEYEFDNKDRLFSITGRSQLKKGRSDLKIPEW